MSTEYLELLDTAAERLLLWASEVGDGPWSRFKREVIGLAATVSPERQVGPSELARRLSEAGHMEFDWEARRWSVAPPVLATIPGLPHGALLVGARTGELYRRLHALWRGEYDVDAFIRFRPESPGRAPAVRPTYLLGRSRGDVETAAHHLDISVSYHPAFAIAEELPRIADVIAGRSLALPPPDSEVRTFNPHDLAWADGRLEGTISVRRYKPEMGATRFLYGDVSGMTEVQRSWGIYASLAEHGRDVVQWRHRDVHGELLVPTATPLPDLHARTATLCSGLEPSVTHSPLGSAYHYVNVPREVAEGIAGSLEQHLRPIT